MKNVLGVPVAHEEIDGKKEPIGVVLVIRRAPIKDAAAGDGRLVREFITHVPPASSGILPGTLPERDAGCVTRQARGPPYRESPPLTDEPGETRTISPDAPFVQILDPASAPWLLAADSWLSGTGGTLTSTRVSSVFGITRCAVEAIAV